MQQTSRRSWYKVRPNNASNVRDRRDPLLPSSYVCTSRSTLHSSWMHERLHVSHHTISGPTPTCNATDERGPLQESANSSRTQTCRCYAEPDPSATRSSTPLMYGLAHFWCLFITDSLAFTSPPQSLVTISTCRVVRYRGLSSSGKNHSIDIKREERGENVGNIVPNQRIPSIHLHPRADSMHTTR